MVASFFTAFDPQLKITVREGKVFDGQDKRIGVVCLLPEVDVFTETLEENAMVQYKDRQAMVVLKGVEDNFEELTAIDSILYGAGDFLLHDSIVNYGVMGKKEKKMLRKEMGMIFQSAALFDSMTVFDNVMFPLNMFSNDILRDRIKRAMFCLDRVNLGEAKDKFPGEISGGMQKRVAIARAIALNPQYLFCDEPNSGLDPKTSLVIDDLIHDITQEYNMTTIINTHDMNSVLGIGEKVIYIYEGHKEWEGTKDDIFTSTNERLNNFIFASDLLRKVKDVEVQGMEG